MQTKISLKNAYECCENLPVFATMLLFDLAEKVDTDRDLYLRNAIAKSVKLLESIQILYKQENYNEAWVLFRSLLDRLIHIYYLDKTSSFSEFKKHTYISYFEHVNNARSDERFKRLLNNPSFKIAKEDQQKYIKRKEDFEDWKRPDPKTILDEQGLKFLYKYGYDYASRLVHPMFDDGEREFHALTNLKPNPYSDFEDKILINNSILVCMLLIQEALNAMNINFMRVVYDYLDGIKQLLEGSDSKHYKVNFVKVSKVFQSDMSLSAKKSAT